MGSMIGRGAALMAAVNIMLGVAAFWTVEHAQQLGTFLILQAQADAGLGLETWVLKLLDYGVGLAIGGVFIVWLIRTNRRLASERDGAIEKLIDALKDQNRK